MGKITVGFKKSWKCIKNIILVPESYWFKYREIKNILGLRNDFKKWISLADLKRESTEEGFFSLQSIKNIVHNFILKLSDNYTILRENFGGLINSGLNINSDCTIACSENAIELDSVINKDDWKIF